MNEKSIAHYVKTWAALKGPFRPTPDGLSRYADTIVDKPGASVLILGGTPELVDLAKKGDARTIVRVDASPEILTAMETFAQESWKGVESLSGDWLAEHRRFTGCFDLIWSDGGPLFLPYPDCWSTLLERAGMWLKTGGLLETKIQSPPIDADEVERRRRALLERQPGSEEDFILQMSDLWQLCHFDAIGSDGATDRERVGHNHSRYRTLALEAFPKDAAIIEDTFAGFVDHDGLTSLQALPSCAQLKPILDDCPLSFVSETLLADSRPAANYCWHLRLRKD